MKTHSKYFGIEKMALILGVTASGYYSYCSRDPSKHEQEDKRWLGLIMAIFKNSRETYGRVRIHKELREMGEIWVLLQIFLLALKIPKRFSLGALMPQDRKIAQRLSYLQH